MDNWTGGGYRVSEAFGVKKNTDSSGEIVTGIFTEWFTSVNQCFYSPVQEVSMPGNHQ